MADISQKVPSFFTFQESDTILDVEEYILKNNAEDEFSLFSLKVKVGKDVENCVYYMVNIYWKVSKEENVEFFILSLKKHFFKGNKMNPEYFKEEIVETLNKFTQVVFLDYGFSYIDDEKYHILNIPLI